MEVPVLLNNATVNTRVPRSLSPNAWRWRAILGGTSARFGCTALLLIAAVLKAYQLFTDPALGMLHGSHWLQAALVDYELLLALWLLSGIGLRWGRRIALVTFLGFGYYAFFLGLSGKASCGCFGKVHVNPWWTFGIDAALTFLLIIWKPQRREDSDSDSGYLQFTGRVCLIVAAVSAVIGVPALSLAVRRPGLDSSIESALAHSRFVLLEPEKWTGKPFLLTDYIDMTERERLSHGSWIVVFYRHDCPKCQQAHPQYERLAEQVRSADEETNIAMIELPPYGPSVLATIPFCHHGRLNESKEWLITTPAEVRITNGRVIAASWGWR